MQGEATGEGEDALAELEDGWQPCHAWVWNGVDWKGAPGIWKRLLLGTRSNDSYFSKCKPLVSRKGSKDAMLLTPSALGRHQIHLSSQKHSRWIRGVQLNTARETTIRWMLHDKISANLAKTPKAELRDPQVKDPYHGELVILPGEFAIK